MTSPNALFDALRVPRQVVVDDGLAELQIEAFRSSLSADWDSGSRSKLVNEGEPYLQPRDSDGTPGGTCSPLPAATGLCLLRAIGIIRAAKQRDLFVSQAGIKMGLTAHT